MDKQFRRLCGLGMELREVWGGDGCQCSTRYQAPVRCQAQAGYQAYVGY